MNCDSALVARVWRAAAGGCGSGVPSGVGDWDTCGSGEGWQHEGSTVLSEIAGRGGFSDLRAAEGGEDDTGSPTDHL